MGQQGAAGSLQYGTFELEQGASYDQLIQALSVYAAAETTRLTFPEGTTAIAIAQQMEQAGLCTAEEFLQEANEGDFSEFTFWQYLPTDQEAPDRFMKCEGYLFPDTYEFLNDGTVHDYVATFYARFDQMITPNIYEALEQQGMTLHQLVTLASFVQEEAGNDQDSNVAQVFRNRLAPDSPYPRLESNVSSYIQSDEDNNYLWNWVAPWYGGWDEIPANILAAYDTYSCAGAAGGACVQPRHRSHPGRAGPPARPRGPGCLFLCHRPDRPLLLRPDPGTAPGQRPGGPRGQQQPLNHIHNKGAGPAPGARPF